MDFIFLNDSGVVQNLDFYKLRLASSGQSVETVRDSARVYDAGAHTGGANAPGVNMPRSNPPPTYGCLLSGTPAAPWTTYANHLLVRSLGGFLAIAPTVAGTISHEQRAVDYTYNVGMTAWTTTITDSTEEGRTGLQGPVGPAGPAGAGFVAKLAENAVLAGEVPSRMITTESGYEAVGAEDARQLDLKVCAPVFRVQGSPPSFVIGNCGDLQSLSGSTANQAAALAKVDATDANFSTGGLGTAFAASSVLSFVGIVSLGRDITGTNGFHQEPVSIATLATIREDVFPKAPGTISNNVYLVFVRPASISPISSGTDWYIAGYSSQNTSTDLTVNTLVYNRRSMLVSSGVGFARSAGVNMGSMNRIVLQTRSDTFTLPA